MILTLTPNPAVDLTITVTELTRGASVVAPAARRRAGGKGLNVARVLVEQGVDALALAPVGRESLDWFDRDLADVPHHLVPCAGPTRTSYALVESGPDVTTVVNEAGVARSRQEWRAVLDALAERLPAARCLVVSGSLPPDSPEDLVDRVVRAGRGAGVPVVADLSGAALLAAAGAGAAVLKPNRHELVGALGEVSALDGARELQRRGAGLVVVSLGAEGLLVVPADGGPVTARLPQPLRGNPTGAGDAAVAALAALVAAGERDPAALARRATAWSAAAVLVPWAGSIHPDHAALERDVVLSAR